MKRTIKDVAKASGVSVSTASMALNNRAGVSEITRARVRKVAREMNYIPDYSARSLVMQDSNCLGLIIPEIENPFFSAIVAIMTRIAEKMNYTLILGITNSNEKQEAEYVRMFLSRRVRGVIVVPMNVNHPDVGHLDLLRAADVPMVFCTETYHGCAEPQVVCDFEAGQYQATKHLLDKGMRSFWFVSVDMDVQFAHLRYAGHCKALKEAGIAVNPNRLLLAEGPHYQAAYDVSDRIVKDPTDAVLCINDIMAMAIMTRMGENKIRIPNDISLVGFDNIMFSDLVSPPLTTVQHPLQEICKKTMEILERKISAGKEQEQVEKGEIYRIPCKLVVRGTTI